MSVPNTEPYLGGVCPCDRCDLQDHCAENRACAAYWLWDRDRNWQGATRVPSHDWYLGAIHGDSAAIMRARQADPNFSDHGGRQNAQIAISKDVIHMAHAFLAAQPRSFAEFNDFVAVNTNYPAHLNKRATDQILKRLKRNGQAYHDGGLWKALHPESEPSQASR